MPLQSVELTVELIVELIVELTVELRAELTEHRAKPRHEHINTEAEDRISRDTEDVGQGIVIEIGCWKRAGVRASYTASSTQENLDTARAQQETEPETRHIEASLRFFIGEDRVRLVAGPAWTPSRARHVT